MVRTDGKLHFFSRPSVNSRFLKVLFSIIFRMFLVVHSSGLLFSGRGLVVKKGNKSEAIQHSLHSISLDFYNYGRKKTL